MIFIIPAKGVVLDNGSESSNLSFSAETLGNSKFPRVFPFPGDFVKVALNGALCFSTPDTTPDMEKGK